MKILLKILFFVLVFICLVTVIMPKNVITFMDEKYELATSQIESGSYLNQYFLVGSDITNIERYITVREYMQNFSIDEWANNLDNRISQHALQYQKQKLSDNKLIVFYHILYDNNKEKPYVNGTYSIIVNNPSHNKTNLFSFEKRYYINKRNSMNRIYSEIKKDNNTIPEELKNIKIPKVRKTEYHKKYKQ